MSPSKWLPYDDSLDAYALKEVSKLLKIFLYVVPIVAIILAIVNFSLGLNQIALTILSVPIFCLFSLVALHKEMINLSVIILISILIAVTTLSCVLGNGIHETGVMIFPVIVLFSSLVMNIRGVVITTSTVVLCLAYIVFGEQYGLHPSSNVSSVYWVDLVVLEVVTIINIFVTYSFSNITKRNLDRVQVELENQEKYKGEINENLKEKSELLQLVHHRVKNNLLLINSLIELETYKEPKVKEEIGEVILSIHTIARAHDPLYHTDDYKEVAIKLYIEKLIVTYIQSSGYNHVLVDLEDQFLYHEKALLLGIILQKILSKVHPQSNEGLAIKFIVKEKESQLMISCSKGDLVTNNDYSLIELLAKDLNAGLDIQPNKVTVSLPTQ